MLRFKIALFSVLISGSVLVTFGFFFLTVINRVGLDRMDREILTLGESQLHLWHSKDHWKNFDRSLRSIYGNDHWQDLIVCVTDARHEILYKSPHWPEQISINAFPGFVKTMATDLPNNGIRPGPLPPQADPANMLRRNLNRPPPPHMDEGSARFPRPPPLGRPEDMRIKKPSFKSLDTAAGSWRTGIMGNQHTTLILGMNMAGFQADVRRTSRAILFSIPLALLLIAGGGWWLAHRALKPINLITQTAANITARGLGQRIPESGSDSDLLQLIKVINTMLNRLEKSFTQAVRFSGDAAHELQTPLTILQGMLDDAVQNTRNGSDEQRRSSDLLEEVQRLKVIVQKLLLLSRADAGQLALHTRTLNMSEMTESIVEDVGAVAPHLNVEQQIAPGVAVEADPELLQQVIHNLTSNAIKYNKKDGLIKIGLTKAGKYAQLTISNTGTPIPDNEKEHIFDRFYRIDKSRSDAISGSGLGLALALEIVRAHKGKLTLERVDNNLITFKLLFPVAQ